MPEDNFALQTYTNPVYSSSFPDPYVLKFQGEYFAYCTGFAAEGTVFGILRSQDLVTWTEVGGAMLPLESGPPFYWAPEVTYAGGQFYLYYSAGNETLMEIRVAVSDRPDGGFKDSGQRLTSQDFAIDAHVFTDTDGTRYMFYATDFLEHTYMGTGTVVDKMVDWFTLEGRPRPVTRARYDWQVYDPVRKEKGGVRWHTVEGPFVLKRKGLYYEMFSGGNWQNISYGVGFAVTDDIGRNREWKQFADGKKVLPILRTLPGKVIGPGHNSVIRGPNNRELYCVYHRWVNDARVLAVDRMDFAGNRIFVRGPSDTPQFIPFTPGLCGFADGSFQESGSWSISNSEARSSAEGSNRLIFSEPTPYYLAEVTIQNTQFVNGSCGLSLADERGDIFELRIFGNYAETWIVRDTCLRSRGYRFTEGRPAIAPHHLRVELDGRYLRLTLNDSDVRFERLLERPPAQFVLKAHAPETTFSALSITRGFEDLFEQPGLPEENGWQRVRGNGRFYIHDYVMILASRNSLAVTKGPAYADYEFAANIRLLEEYQLEKRYGFEIRHEGAAILTIEIDRQRVIAGDLVFDLPASFMPENYHQFRMLKLGKVLHLQMEEINLGIIPIPADNTQIALFCESASIALDMVRLTGLTNSLTSPSAVISS